MQDYPPVLRYLIRILFAFALISALIITRNLLVPLFFAVLLAYLLFPAATRLEDLGISRIATNLILVITTVVFVLGSVYLVALLAASFSEDLPEIQKQLEQNVRNFQNSIGELLGISKSKQESLLKSIGGTGEYVSQFFTATANSILALGLIPVYTFLLLFYRNKFRKFLSMLVKNHQEETAQNIIDQASEVVPQYLKGLCIVCFILMGLNSLGFFLIGIKYALLLGILAAVFNFIPYLGTVIGYALVFLFVLVAQSPTLAAGVFIQFFIVQFLENNILTPNITGSYVKINPLVTILSLLAGGMIWGLPGMFMIIPYLAMMKIICENIESLKPIGFLLGTRGTEQYSFSFTSLKKKLGWKS